MSIQKIEAPKFEITIQTFYVPEESRPHESYYFFVYKINIKNIGNTPATLSNRHWIIANAFGNIEEVQGEGVVGVKPLIKPGHTFEYESACPLNTSSGSMKGSYHFVTDSNEKFSVTIPEFYLVSPQAIN